jgi:hypothetical protein
MCGHGGRDEGCLSRVDRSPGRVLLPRLRDEILGEGQVRIGSFVGTLDITRLSLPHVAQHLYMAGDLFPGPFYAGLLKIIDEELVAPP